MTLTADAGVGVRASDGKLMWRQRHGGQQHRQHHDAGLCRQQGVLHARATAPAAALLGLRAAGGEVQAQEIYFTREMQNHHGGVVLVNGYHVRLQQLDPDVPRVRDRQDDVA